MAYTFKEICEYGFSKEEFLNYYDKCLLFGITPCVDAKFKISDTKHISVDILHVKQDKAEIPYFVTSIFKEKWYEKWNDTIEYLDLCNVNTIEFGGLCNFKALLELKGNHLEGIGGEGLRDCEKLTELNLPKLVNIGQNALYGCNKLQRIVVPKLKNTHEGWLGHAYSLKYLEAPELRVLYPILPSWYSGREIEVVLSSDIKIYEQQNIFFIINGKKCCWFGEEVNENDRDYYKDAVAPRSGRNSKNVRFDDVKGIYYALGFNKDEVN